MNTSKSFICFDTILAALKFLNRVVWIFNALGCMAVSILMIPVFSSWGIPDFFSGVLGAGVYLLLGYLGNKLEGTVCDKLDKWVSV